MPIGTIDIATLAPRTINAAEQQGRENTQNEHIGEQNAVQFQQETQQQAHQTVQTQESELKDYDKESHAGGGMSRKRKREKKEAEEKPKQKMAPRSNSSFDIMI